MSKQLMISASLSVLAMVGVTLFGAAGGHSDSHDPRAAVSALGKAVALVPALR